MPATPTYTRARYQLRQQRSPTLIVHPDRVVLEARQDPGKFGQYVCGKVPADIHKSWFPILVPGTSNDMLNRTAGNDTSLLSFRGSAKAQPLESPILTPNGWTTMGCLRVGDFVATVDGTFTRVNGVFPQGVKVVYKITFSDGSTAECSDDHLWTVRKLGGAKDIRSAQVRTVTLNHLRTKIFVNHRGNYRFPLEPEYRDGLPGEKPWLDYKGYAKYHIPIVEPVLFPKRNLPLDPYLLGALIGDGGLRNLNGAVRFSTADDEILTILAACLPKGLSINKLTNTKFDYYISGNVKTSRRNPVTQGLRDLNLLGCDSSSKFIPSDYLVSSVQDRIALLQGLLDTDGTCNKSISSEKRGGGISFCTVSLRLVRDVVELVRSLGGIATPQKPQQNFYTYKGEKRQGKTSYRIGIKLPKSIEPFRLSRKKAIYNPPLTYTPTRAIVDIECVGEKEMQCISVEHPSHLYVTQDYVLTHNTTWLRIITAWEYGHNPHLQLGWVSYSEAIALKSSRVIKRIIASPRYREVFPHIRPGTRWGDVDWEIDKAFASVSTLDSDISFQALGATGAVTSNRFHKIVFDDLIKSKKHIANEDVRATMLETIQDAIEPCLIPGGRMINLATRWRNDDIHATYFTGENGWTVIEQGAIITGDDRRERSAWAERFTLEFLQDIRRRKPLTWLYQYMNQLPNLNEEQPIKPEHIKYGEIPPNIHSLTLGVDLAAGEEEKDDYTALVLCGKDDENYYILYAEELRSSGNLAKIKRILELRKKWNFSRIVCEKNAYQKSFEGDWKDYCRRYRVQNITCEMVASVEDKRLRLENISGIFENGFVIFNKHAGMQRLVSQLLGIDKDHDDLQDACEKSLSRLQRRARKPLKGSD